MTDFVGDPTHNPEYEVTPRFVAAALQDGAEPILLLDCREHDELAIARIEGALHIPMSELGSRIDELEQHAEACGSAGQPARIIVSCHSGRRSLQVALLLREAGYEDAASMAGGIDWWSRQIDPTVPRY